ncbi:MAG: hypothetical protein GY868_14550 [Deltaproteobacteria bacterium]|nr:hypothetical protein [Deltaproteobacteria bacterium]
MAWPDPQRSPLLQRHPDTGVRYQEAGIRILAQREDAAAWAFIEQIAGDHPHECNELANLFLKRYKEGRTQPAWSG